MKVIIIIKNVSNIQYKQLYAIDDKLFDRWYTARIWAIYEVYGDQKNIQIWYQNKKHVNVMKNNNKL